MQPMIAMWRPAPLTGDGAGLESRGSYVRIGGRGPLGAIGESGSGLRP